MNKKILILIAFLGLTANFYGQRRPGMEKIKSLKVAFFSERLDLSSSEAEAFWPVYNAHEKQMNSFRRIERTEFRGKLQNLEAMSDKDAEKLLQKYMDLQEKKQREQQSFVAEMKGILSAKKTILLLKTEEDFKKQLLKQYRQRRGGG
ncbi:MAG: hypothetical protein ABJN95_10415 [Maribacter sp.]|uniref:hypothetical protein n=1 Tax=Maribacter sp. TaxID=1897614 RepID=UPI003299FD25